MASENVKKVTKIISENLCKGKKIVLGQILLESGYAESTAKTPSNVTDTKTYQAEMKPLIQRMDNLRNKVIEEMNNKDLTKERFDTLGNSLRNLTHDIQLIGGKSTENIGVNDLTMLSDAELRNYTSISKSGVSEEGTS